jgi:hypothetical protein
LNGKHILKRLLLDSFFERSIGISNYFFHHFYFFNRKSNIFWNIIRLSRSQLIKFIQKNNIWTIFYKNA